jgi:hypothetical protein
MHASRSLGMLSTMHLSFMNAAHQSPLDWQDWFAI